MDNPKISAIMACTFLLAGVQVMTARPAFSQAPEPQVILPERPSPDQHVARIKAISARVDEYLKSATTPGLRSMKATCDNHSSLTLGAAA
jgi:hypothetical protein